MVIDARGQGCPKPVMMAEEALSKITEGIAEIIVDNEASADNLEWFAKSNAFYSETVRDGNEWRVKIVKGYACAPTTAAKKHQGQKKTCSWWWALIRWELGKILMKAYFETMKTYKQMPHTIFFLNAGVKLTTTDADVCPILKEIEAMGVEMYSWGTCLKH